MLLYPVYALLFADAGLGAGQISSLFAIWTVTGIVFEVPSGAWADAFSRRRLLALSGGLRAVAFGLWVAWPVGSASYEAFAVGFVLWGVAGAMQSGTTEALLYDELAAAGAADRYATTLGRGETVALLSVLGATVAAAPAYAIGGYPLVGALSVAASLASAGVALSFPETPRVRAEDVGGVRHYLATLRAGVAEVRGDRRVGRSGSAASHASRPGTSVGRAVALVAALTGLMAVDEYLPLLAREMGASTAVVPLLFVLPLAAMATVSAVAGRWARVRAGRLAAATGLGAALLAGGALVPHPAGMLGVTGAFALFQLGMVVTDVRLQESISGPARATVTSVASVGAEVAGLLVVGVFAVGSAWWDVSALVALCAVPLLALAALVRRWLPAYRGAGADSVPA